MFQFRRQAQPTAEQYERFLSGFGEQQRVLELAQQDGVGISEEQVEILEQNDSVSLQSSHGVQDFQRVVVVLDLFGLRVDEAAHHRPVAEGVGWLAVLLRGGV